MGILLNPQLQGVGDQRNLDGRFQAIPPNWNVSGGSATGQPEPEIFNKPGGSELHVAFRTIDLWYHQPIQIQPGRYVLKAIVDRRTDSTPQAETDLGWGFRVVAGEAVYDFHSGHFSRVSEEGTMLAVLQVNESMPISIGVVFETLFASQDGYVLVKLIDAERVANNYGTPQLTLGAAGAEPIPDPAPTPTPSPTPTPTPTPAPQPGGGSMTVNITINVMSGADVQVVRDLLHELRLIGG